MLGPATRVGGAKGVLGDGAGLSRPGVEGSEGSAIVEEGRSWRERRFLTSRESFQDDE